VTESRLIDGRLELRRSDDDKKPLLRRLAKIEGQVRGLRTMIEEDRYCLDEVQQINAVTAALREVALLIISQHVAQGVQLAVREQESDGAVEDVMRVLTALRCACAVDFLRLWRRQKSCSNPYATCCRPASIEIVLSDARNCTRGRFAIAGFANRWP
jgi:DNA-binding FrmR family transcriptional regulator